MPKYMIFLILALWPALANSTDLYVDFAYTGDATSFELYQDDVLLCTEPDSTSRLIICPVTDEVSSSHVYYIVAKSDGDDVVGETVTYNQDTIAPTVRWSVLVDSLGKRGRRTFYRTVGEETLPYAPVAGAGGSFQIRAQ